MRDGRTVYSIPEVLNARSQSMITIHAYQLLKILARYYVFLEPELLKAGNRMTTIDILFVAGGNISDVRFNARVGESMVRPWFGGRGWAAAVTVFPLCPGAPTSTPTFWDPIDRGRISTRECYVSLLCNAGENHGGRLVSILSTHFGIGVDVPGDAAGPVARVESCHVGCPFRTSPSAPFPLRCQIRWNQD